MNLKSNYRCWVIIYVAVTLSFATSAGRAAAQPGTIAPIIRRMEGSRDKHNWTEMISACREAVAAGSTDEYLLRSLSWGLCRAGESDEGFDVASRNWRLNPCAWSLEQLVDAATDAGRFEDARKAARILAANRAQWGTAAAASQVAIDRVSSRTYHFVWMIDTANEALPFSNKSGIRIPVPWTKTRWQNAKWSISGAKSWQEETIGESVCVRVVPDGKSPFGLEADVTLTPCTYKAEVQKAKEADYPDEVKHYLGKAPGIDPDSQRAKSIVESIKGKSRFESIFNVMKWCRSNMQYKGIVGESGGTSDEVLARRNGHCEAMTTATVTLLRACGIPARYIRGQTAIRGERGTGLWHTITEYYVTGLGWLPWDQLYPPFAIVPEFLCTFTYAYPYDLNHTTIDGDLTMWDLWRFQSLGLNCEFCSYTLVRTSLD